MILINQRYRQTDRQTDGRHAISIPRYALVHRAVKSDVVCVDSNLISPSVSRGPVDSSLSPVSVSFTSSRTTPLPDSREERTVTEQGQLT